MMSDVISVAKQQSLCCSNEIERWLWTLS